MEFLIGQYILSLNLPDYLNFILIFSFEFAIVTLFFIITVIIISLSERKITERFILNDSQGRSGFSDCIKILANFIKVLFKEKRIPKNTDKLCFILAPIIVFVPVLFVYTMIPFNTDFCVCKFDSGLILLISMLLLPVFGIIYGGYASKNEFSIISSIRSFLIMISYEIPLLISVMSVVVLSETLSMPQIVIAQAKYDVFSWFIFPSFLGFLIFCITGLEAIERTPFSFSKEKSELIKGYENEYTGINQAIFRISEYGLLFIICALASTLFLGGFLSPFGIYIADFFANNMYYYVILTGEQIFWLLAKSTILILTVFLIKLVFPTLRQDTTAYFSWKYLIPLSIINLLFVCIIKSAFGGIYA